MPQNPNLARLSDDFQKYRQLIEHALSPNVLAPAAAANLEQQAEQIRQMLRKASGEIKELLIQASVVSKPAAPETVHIKGNLTAKMPALGKLIAQESGFFRMPPANPPQKPPMPKDSIDFQLFDEDEK